MWLLVPEVTDSTALRSSARRTEFAGAGREPCMTNDTSSLGGEAPSYNSSSARHDRRSRSRRADDTLAGNGASGPIRTVQGQLIGEASHQYNARTVPELNDRRRNNSHTFRTVLDARVNRRTDELWQRSHRAQDHRGDGDSRIAHEDGMRGVSRSNEVSDSGASESRTSLEEDSNSEVHVISGHTANNIFAT